MTSKYFCILLVSLIIYNTVCSTIIIIIIVISFIRRKAAQSKYIKHRTNVKGRQYYEIIKQNFKM